MIHIENISKQEQETASSRRGFLKGMLGAGAFVLSVRWMPEQVFAASTVPNSSAAEAMGKAAWQPSVYLALDTDGTAYVVAHRSEMGNGVRTSLPRIVADELDADWARVKVVQATGDEKYGDQDTDGSHSVVSFFVPLREAGATARLMLVRAAAKQWNVPEGECSTELHNVVHKVTGKKLGYGELAAAAAKLEVPKKEALKLKPRSEWRYIGKDAAGYDLKDLCTGKGIFGQDTRMDGMLYASVLHPPVLGSSVKSVDDKAALAVSGVKQTATIDTFKPPVLFQALGGVAVLADNTWAAMQGRKKLRVEWEESSHRVFNSGPYRKELEDTARKPGKVVREVGNALVHDAGAAVGKRAEHDVAVAGHPADVGGAPVHVGLGVEVEDVPVGERHLGEVAAGGVPRRKSRGLGPHAKSRGRARCDRRGCGSKEGRRDRTRHAARWRVWQKILPGFCGGSGCAFEKNWQASESGLEPRGRH